MARGDKPRARFEICERCMQDVVLPAKRLPLPDRMCGLCRGRYEIVLYYHSAGPKPEGWDRLGASFIKQRANR